MIAPRSITSRALRFVLLVGVMSFFADFTYEGARSIVGPYLATLGAGSLVVGVVAGFGELLGYGLRLFSGSLSDKTRQFWPIMIGGYLLQMTAVPLLALAGSWPVAALLIVLERVGKATRNPPRDVMLSRAGASMGYGWAFGVHEALDQAGALFGPLALAGVLALHNGGYRLAFAVLAIPAAVMLSVLALARITYPRPEELEKASATQATAASHPAERARYPRIFWVYLAGACLVALGFADFPLIAFHFQKAGTVRLAWVPVFYAVAMGVSGAGSLLFGRLFDRAGIGVLVPLTLVSAAFAPLVFLGGFWTSLIGVSLWGMGMGVHESIVPAAVAGMVPAERRASAYGLFTAGYGVLWFLGSATIGGLLGISVASLVAFSVAAELSAIPLFLYVRRRLPVR
jgi:MFS family permease